MNIQEVADELEGLINEIESMGMEDMYSASLGRLKEGVDILRKSDVSESTEAHWFVHVVSWKETYRVEFGRSHKYTVPPPFGKNPPYPFNRDQMGPSLNLSGTRVMVSQDFDDYSCNCISYLVHNHNHNGRYCKHITNILKEQEVDPNFYFGMPPKGATIKEESV